MSKIDFPDPSLADENGILALGGNFEVETLQLAYSKGIFPWPQAGHTFLWFSPKNRGVILFKDFHVPKSLKKEMKKGAYRFTFNRAFEQVIKYCAISPRKTEAGLELGTWITPEIITAYLDFHKTGFAHSLECWHGDELVGGLYGVWVSGVFMGESMFFLKPNTSKMCVVKLAEFLMSKGHEWMDTQMVTPVVKLLGGKYISRTRFLCLLSEAQRKFPYESLKPALAPGDDF
ncbi:MAG: leucyl/phenylalanyl-tRNA--protein transferase [Pseudomonadota bacterium]|nr:leucyl/phenylalanyl-tRNA--protein transferase [Pseudomonadota bacterium]